MDDPERDEDISGPRHPTEATPPRRPGSVRRTCTTDMLWPDGVDGPLLLQGHGRDLRTTSEDDTHVLAEADLEARVDQGWRLLSLEVTPELPRAEELAGARVGPGFRSAVDERCRAVDAERSLLHQLLDDMPVTTLISRYATVIAHAASGTGRGARMRPTVDLCAGFQAGGSLQTTIERRGRPPLRLGAPAPDLRGDDPLAWPQVAPLPTHGMRRARRLDVVAVGGNLVVDAMFRDSYRGPSGKETLVHEYTLEARLDPVSLVIEAVTATPRALPWRECPQAAASPARLVGRSVHDLRAHVRTELTGIGTCTHLNDLLRSLADVVALAPAVAPA